jgi:hypothetical protein
VSAVDWAVLVVSILTIVGAFGASVRFLVKHYLYELKPNSGSSINDRVRKLETKVDQIYHMLIKKENNENLH